VPRLGSAPGALESTVDRLSQLVGLGEQMLVAGRRGREAGLLEPASEIVRFAKAFDGLATAAGQRCQELERHVPESEAERLVAPLCRHLEHQYNRCSMVEADKVPNTSDVSDACDELGVKAVRTGLLKPLWPNCPAVAGLVTSVRLEPAEGAPSPLPELLEVLAEGPPGLLLVDLGGRTDHQCWGSVLATAARYYGMVGALVNGAARDVDELRELRFPSYARGVHPAEIRNRLRLSAVNERVDIDGVLVEPDSFAVADSSGAVFFPAHRSEEVLQLARRRKAEEVPLLNAVRAGADPRTVFVVGK
jgi:4-hydroxy-4-methyl-2-oxoglutarate aldolase